MVVMSRLGRFRRFPVDGAVADLRALPLASVLDETQQDAEDEERADHDDRDGHRRRDHRLPVVVGARPGLFVEYVARHVRELLAA